MPRHVGREGTETLTVLGSSPSFLSSSIVQ
jgi:hypothetical protein